VQAALDAGDAQDPGIAEIEERNQAITNQDATPMVEEAPALNQAIYKPGRYSYDRRSTCLLKAYL
jgi:hypothetical protein